MAGRISRLLFPFAIFLAFLGLKWFVGELDGSLSPEVVDGITHGLTAGAWLAGAVCINRLLALVVWGWLLPRAMGRLVPNLIVQIASLAVYLAVIAAIIGLFYDKPLTTLITTSSAAGLLIGFASRSLIFDVFSGIAISLDQPFRVGDFVNVQGRTNTKVVGIVKEINWRTTRLLTPENTSLVIPNSMMSESIILNASAPDSTSEFEQLITLDYSVPVERALRVLGSALHLAMVDGGISSSPPGRVRLDKLTENGVQYKATYMVDLRKTSAGKSKHIVLKHLMDSLHQAGLSPAAARRDIYTARMPHRYLDYDDLAHRAHLLARAELFADLDTPALNHLGSQMIIRVVPTGEIVVQEGESGTSMYIVVEGIFDVKVGLDAATSHIVGQLRPGDFFGEVAALSGQPRTATVFAATEAVLCEIRRDDILSLLEAYPEVGSMLHTTIERRYLKNAQKLAAARLGAPELSKEITLANQIMRNLATYFGRVFKVT